VFLITAGLPCPQCSLPLPLVVFTPAPDVLPPPPPPRLHARYYINLVPYQLIKRSKFVYHYIPALLMGVQLVVFVCHVAASWSRLAGRPMVGTALVATVYAVAGWGFVYWGIPYGYGIPLTWEQHQARRWLPTW
jgi:dolichyl-phosphate-mannose--protein O-mannosyl transferase